eukprot:3731076-Alexandrium_andersonii.AAC.1
MRGADTACGRASQRRTRCVFINARHTAGGPSAGYKRKAVLAPLADRSSAEAPQYTGEQMKLLLRALKRSAH